MSSAEEVCAQHIEPFAVAKASPKTTRHPYPIWLFNEKQRQYQDKRKHDSNQRVLKRLHENGGFMNVTTFKEHNITPKGFTRLLHEGKIWVISVNRSTSTGPFKRKVEIFHPKYKNKTFVCVSRTAVVRLLNEALLPISNSCIQRTVRAFLRGVCSEAELLAVLWNRGYDFEAKPHDRIRTMVRSQSISLDGFYQGKRTEARKK